MKLRNPGCLNHDNTCVASQTKELVSHSPWGASYEAAKSGLLESRQLLFCESDKGTGKPLSLRRVGAQLR